jgi:phenylpyruvate tautomerase PptA (4-oxalocrotonate tautomerase family)
MKTLLASLDDEKKKALIDRLAQVIEEQYYALGKPLTTETLFLIAYA